VRHEGQSNHESRVGIYFAHSEHSDGAVVAHFHCNITFNDLVNEGQKDANGVHRGNKVMLQAHCQSLRQFPAGRSELNKAYFYKADRLFQPARAFGMLGPWRKIAVEVRPESLTVYWKEECFATIPRATLMLKTQDISVMPNQPLPKNRPQFAPRDGLGLYVSLGVASFRNVTVEPLNDEN
jgi:hypothetical protein